MVCVCVCVCVQAVVETVLLSVKNVMSVLIVYIVFQFMFTVIGVQLFKGRFFLCTDDSQIVPQRCQ